MGTAATPVSWIDNCQLFVLSVRGQPLFVYSDDYGLCSTLIRRVCGVCVCVRAHTHLCICVYTILDTLGPIVVLVLVFEVIFSLVCIAALPGHTPTSSERKAPFPHILASFVVIYFLFSHSN